MRRIWLERRLILIESGRYADTIKVIKMDGVQIRRYIIRRDFMNTDIILLGIVDILDNLSVRIFIFVIKITAIAYLTSTIRLLVHVTHSYLLLNVQLYIVNLNVHTIFRT